MALLLFAFCSFFILSLSLSLSLYIYIYIYICVCGWNKNFKESALHNDISNGARSKTHPSPEESARAVNWRSPQQCHHMRAATRTRIVCRDLGQAPTATRIKGVRVNI